MNELELKQKEEALNTREIVVKRDEDDIYNREMDLEIREKEIVLNNKTKEHEIEIDKFNKAMRLLNTQLTVKTERVKKAGNRIAFLEDEVDRIKGLLELEQRKNIAPRTKGKSLSGQ